ncbi:hypothetical protein C8F01DRAFT_1179344 [Mycena amicta]|nr:hypothetical protein C8F01DRAFT_1179344 [Mycena amicta]
MEETRAKNILARRTPDMPLAVVLLRSLSFHCFCGDWAAGTVYAVGAERWYAALYGYCVGTVVVVVVVVPDYRVCVTEDGSVATARMSGGGLSWVART